GIGTAVVCQPVVEGGAVGRGIRWMEVVDRYHHMRKSAIDHGHIDALSVHSLQRRDRIVATLTHWLVQMFSRCIQVLLGANHLSGACPGRNDVPLHIPVREIGWTPT